MNLEKMRKQNYKGTPDRVTRSFDRFEEPWPAPAWQEWFCRRMSKKHGDKLHGVKAYMHDDNLEDPREVKYTLEAILEKS